MKIRRGYRTGGKRARGGAVPPEVAPAGHGPIERQPEGGDGEPCSPDGPAGIPALQLERW